MNIINRIKQDESRKMKRRRGDLESGRFSECKINVKTC